LWAWHGERMSRTVPYRTLIAGTVAALWVGLPACSGGPTSPKGSPIGIRVKAAQTTVDMGEVLQLEAVAISADGAEAPVTPLWTATPNAVAAVSQTGALIGLKLGRVAVTATANGQSGSAIFRVVNEDFPPNGDFSGAWSGGGRIAECIRVSGTGPFPCRTETQDFRLQLQQTGFNLAAVFSIGGSAGQVTGWRGFTGDVYLEGTIPGDGTLELIGWETHSAPPFVSMRGTFEVLHRFTNGFGPQILRVFYELESVTR
jgi:hypothetical protein